QAWVDLLGALRPMTPRAVALDIAFYDASPDPDQDRALGSAIKDAGNVILAMQGAGAHADGDGAVRYSAEQLPIPMLRQAAAGVAAVNVFPDEDSRVRKAELVIDTPSGRYYSLPLVVTVRSLLAAKLVTGDETSITREGGVLRLPGRPGLADRAMPIDDTGHMPIYYAAPPARDLTAVKGTGAAPCADPNELCVVSLADVVAGKVPRELIANRTILVGAHSLSAVPDSYPVPNSGALKMWG